MRVIDKHSFRLLTTEKVGDTITNIVVEMIFDLGGVLGDITKNRIYLIR